MTYQVDLDRSRGGGLGDFGYGACAFVVREYTEQNDSQGLGGEFWKMGGPYGLYLLLVGNDDGTPAPAVPIQPGFDIGTGTNHPIRIQELPGLVSPPGHDVSGAVRTPVGDAGVAGSWAGFAAVKTLGPAQQVYLRTDRVIIMDGHVERHVQAVDKAANVHVHLEKVMDVNPGHIHRSEQGDQVVEPARR